MNKLKNQKGITIVALVVTVVVILIIAGITVKYGTDAIKTAKVESLMTNMITIKAKGKGYAEEINAKIWDLPEGEEKNKNRNDLFLEKNMTVENDNSEISDIINIEVLKKDNEENVEYVVYYVSKEALNQMGLEELANNSDDGEYAIVYNLKDFTKFDVLYIDGIDYQENTYYNLSSLQEEVEK